MQNGAYARQMTTADFKDALSKLPPIEVYRENLGILQSLNLKNASQEEVRQTFFKYAGLLPYQTGTLPIGHIDKLTVYRARVAIDEGLEDTRLMRTFSYPSPGQCRVQGRANLAGQPVFYASDVPLGALAETRPKAGQIVHLSEWSFQCSRDVHYRTFLPLSIPTQNLWYNAAVNQARFRNEDVGRSHPEKREHLIRLFDVVSDLFVSESRPYPVTSWLANKTIYDFDGIDFIVYPSATSAGVVCNLAFHPNFIDRFARLESVARVAIRSVDKNGVDMSMNFRINRVGLVHRTHVRWEPPSEANTNWIPGRKQIEGAGSLRDVTED